MPTTRRGCAPAEVSPLPNAKPAPDGGAAQRRVKCVVSDGATRCTALLATQCADLVESGELKPLCVVQVDDLLPGNNLNKGGKTWVAAAAASAAAWRCMRACSGASCACLRPACHLPAVQHAQLLVQWSMRGPLWPPPWGARQPVRGLC